MRIGRSDRPQGPARARPGASRAHGGGLTHRGPDEDGSLFAPGLGIASAAAQHRRRSRTASSRSINEDRTVAVICNGELFDYPERKAELEAQGPRLPHASSDCELIVHTLRGARRGSLSRSQRPVRLRARGLRQAHRADGARPRRHLPAASGRGQGDFLYFGSEIKALLASGAVQARVDPRGLDHLFTFFALGTRRTAFEGVQSVLPGYYLRITLPGAGSEPPRSPNAHIGTSTSRIGATRTIRKTTDGGGRRVRGEVHRADRDQAQGRRAGGRLSLAAASIRPTCSRRRPKSRGSPVPSFTIRCRSAGSTRRPRRASPPRISAAQATVVEAGPDLIAGTYPALIQAAESPVLDTSCAALLALSREVHAQGFKAVVTGEGADEGLAGYVWFKMQRDRAQPRYRRQPAAEHRHQPRGAQIGGAGQELRRARPHRRHDRRPARAVGDVQSRGDVTRRATTAPA